VLLVLGQYWPFVLAAVAAGIIVGWWLPGKYDAERAAQAEAEPE
jgi:hypothetical protein